LPLLGEAHSAPSERGFPLAAKGFRPFFLLAGVFGALLLPLWLLALAGVFHPEAYFNPTYWHAHEMVFGFSTAVIAGFLLTAASRWTSRETVVGKPLLALASLWLAARVVILTASIWPRWLPAAVDLAFLPAVALGIGRPVVASRNWRQAPLMGLLIALFLANLVMHLDVLGLFADGQRRGSLFAVDLVVLVILIMAGRVFPMFTRNATGVKTIRSVPVLDVLALLAMLVVTLLQAGQTAAATTGYAAGVASILCAVRAVHWGARHSLRTPLLWILHLGYAWIPIGLAIRAVAMLDGRVPAVLGTHALTIGAIASVILGMMSRVALGHSGRALVPSRIIVVAFVLISLAACARVFVPLFAVSLYQGSVYAAGILFALAFLLFTIVYFPILTQPRPDGQPG
jgi:uncharacterized protein involved in response to NO